MNLTKRLAQESGLCDISHARYSEKCTQVSGDAMLVSPGGAQIQHIKKHLFFYKCISPSLDELIKIKVIFILRQRMISLQISKTR